MKFSRAVLLIGVLLALAAPLWAQSGVTGTLSGVVTQDGAPLPGVTVTVTSPNLQGERTTVTNAAGGYNFGALPPGQYSATFALEGLTPLTRTARVGVAQNERLDAAMHLSTVTESITVTADAPAVSEATQAQSNFDSALVDALPVQRNITAVTNLAPGVTANGPNNQLMISGGQSFDNLYTVNGAVVNENLRGQPHNLFIEDAIQETTVTQAGVSAEFGNFTGGVVNVITKSGGNDFSGSLRDSLNNPSWTADSPSTYQLNSNGTVRTVDSPTLVDQITHTYEATLGGRIVRDRLWFFLSGRFADAKSSGALLNGTSFITTSEDKRAEVKLTGAITSQHNVVVSYLQAPRTEANGCQSGSGCFDASALAPERELPNDFKSLSYSGTLNSNLLLEARYSEKYFAFVHSGGTDTDLARGTPIQLFFGSLGGAITNESLFCGACGDEERNNQQYGAKATWFFGTRAAGNHNIVAGYDDWTESRLSNNYQSPTNFILRVGTGDITLGPNGETLVSLVPGQDDSADDVVWWPIEQLSQGSSLKTTAFYVNDKWDLGSRWSFNVGGRYDSNHSKDSGGNVVADDAKFSPRLGAMLDVLGDGRLRLGASYSVYVGRLAETIAGQGTTAGTPSAYVFDYQGPELTGVSPEAATAAFFAWFNANGGTSREIVGANIPGFNRRLAGTLVSPNVEEWAVNASTRIGGGFVRLDYIHRDWRDFYGLEANRQLGIVTNRLGQRADLSQIVNTNDLDRHYEAIQLQGAYRLLERVNIGANYTWSELTGNAIGENGGSGPIVVNSSNYYPEYLDFDHNNPAGFLPQDQTHKLRAWASSDFKSSFGNLNVSVLQRWDSGLPYSLAATINVASSANFYGTGLAGGITNPGYASPGSGASQTYYFSDRGAYRFDDLWATDLALNYDTNPAWLGGVGLFAQADVTNVFDNHAVLAFDTTIQTQANAGSGMVRFNPRAGDVPVEGVNYRRGPLFGLPTQPTTPTTSGSYQLPRTYRFSLGLRF